MLPFARMLKYGNKIEVNKIKKIVSSANLEFILLDDGVLYAHGEDSSYTAGLTTNFSSLGEVKQITTGVTNVWTDYLTTVTKENKIFCSGQTYAFTNASTIQQGFADYSSYFTGIDITQIKKMVCGFTFFILMMDGTLYGKGWNRSGSLGLGHTNYVSQWTVLDTGVDTIYGDSGGDTLYKVKLDGKVYGAGSNNASQVQNGTSAALYFVPLFDDISYDITFSAMISIGFMMGTSDNKIYTTGTTLSGTGNHSKVFSINFAIGDMSNIYNKEMSRASASSIFLINETTNELMVSGYTPFNGSSSNILPLVSNFEVCNFPAFDQSMRISFPGYWCTFYNDNNSVWMNGYAPNVVNGKNYSMCSIPLSETFTKQIDLPF